MTTAPVDELAQAARGVSPARRTRAGVQRARLAVPGIAALHMRIVEALVHDWDLARATGQPAELPDDLPARELTFTRGKLADLPPDGRPFAPPRPVADDAPAIDRLAAGLGRRATPDAHRAMSDQSLRRIRRSWCRKRPRSRRDVPPGLPRSQPVVASTPPTILDDPTGKMGATCTHQRYVVAMPRVIQIRDVPDDVHDALRDAAEARGLSLTKYMLGELERLAKQAQVVHDNAAIVRQTQAQVGGGADRGTILAALREGRGE